MNQAENSHPVKMQMEDDDDDQYMREDDSGELEIKRTATSPSKLRLEE